MSSTASFLEMGWSIADRRWAGRMIAGVAAFLLVHVGAAFADDSQLDLRPLVEATQQKRCTESKGYQVIGGVPCDQLSGGASEDPDAALQRVGASAKEQILALSLQAKKEDAACSRGLPNGAGGTSVGASTPEELASTMVKAAIDDATSFSLPVGMMLSIPGVTQVQYEYKGLTKGPELRTFKITGQVEGDVDQPKLRLKLDGDVEGDKNLYLEYTVNYRKTKSPFPAWSPFLDAQADIRPGAVRQGLTTLSSTATFAQTGQQRNGVKVWHEYDYNWQAERIGISPDDVLMSRDSNDYADQPFGGDWVGVGWSSETRFKQTRRAFVGQFSAAAANQMKTEDGADGVIMSVNVKHQMAFYLHIDHDGKASGRGVIIYTLDPNLCAVAALTRQVNEQVNMMKYIPAMYLAASMLGKKAVERFGQKWASTPTTITARMDETLGKLARIEREAGEAQIGNFKSLNKVLPTNVRTNYAFADVEMEGVPVKRMWGVGNDNEYKGIKLAAEERLAPPTPKDAAGKYTGKFQTRHGRPGWFEDGSWWEQSPGQPGTPGQGPGWNRRQMPQTNMRGNDSELRILEELSNILPKQTKGTIRLYTQRPPCSSCAGVIEQFSAMFPDILIVVTSGG